jgi:rhamnose utilization protein RhaD (predicted bifunctional aldolase and dehydrogenase)
MQNSKLLTDLIETSNTLGKRIDYIQGAGGNLSVKISDSEMAIKASGFLLKEIQLKKGISFVDFNKINDYLKKPHDKDDDFNNTINSFVVNNDIKPSIETGFHALLGDFVIHSHSVYVNYLLCTFEGKELIKKIVPQGIWIDYSAPGRSVTLEIMKKLGKALPGNGIIFMQNHGMICWAENSKSALNIHEEINNIIRSNHKFSEFNYLQNAKKENLKHKTILFPDQAVFLKENSKTSETSSAKENAYAYEYILKNIQDNRLTPKFLTEDEIDEIVNMKSEKFRVKIAK